MLLVLISTHFYAQVQLDFLSDIPLAVIIGPDQPGLNTAGLVAHWGDFDVTVLEFHY